MSKNLYRQRRSVRLAVWLFASLGAAGWITFSTYSAKQLVPAGAQTETHSIRRINLTTNDILYNPSDQTIYASVPSSGGAGGNSVARINPQTGAVGESVFVGSEPNKLALAGDNKTLYVALDGASSVRRYDTATQTAGLQFNLGSEQYVARLNAVDLAVAPDNPNVVAAARVFPGGPTAGGVAIFDNGVQRPKTGNGSSSLAFSSNSATLYGSSYYGGLSIMTIDNTGVAALSSTSLNVNPRIAFNNGRIYSSTGQVIDANTKTLIGTFAGVNTHAFVIDSTVGRAYYLVRDSYSSGSAILKVFDINNFTPIGSLTISDVNGDAAASLIRWGANGLAFRTSTNQLILIQTSLIPSAQPIPVVSPTPSATPTVSPTPFAAFIRKVNLPNNDLVYSQPSGVLYASVPSIAGSGIGNTITRIDPQTGATGPSVFIGSEPNKLALADDNRTLYVTLDGANAVRRFDLAAQTPGSQFTPTAAFQRPQDIAVMPSNPDTVALTGAYDGVAVYKNGVQLPNTSNGGAYMINRIEFSASPSILYGYDNYSSGFELIKFAVDNTGVKPVTRTDNLISGYSLDIKFINGLIYATNGQVADPEARTLIGTFQGGGSAMSVDPALGRVFFISNNVLSAYDINTFIKIGSVTIPDLNGTAYNLERWGANGLAFRVVSNSSGAGTNNNQIYLLQSTLVSSAAPVPTGVQFNAQGYSTYEGSQSATITVTRTGDLTAASNVVYATSDGTATAGADYVATSGTLNFAPGEASKTFNITVFNDNVFENGNETVNITLSNVTGSGTLLNPSAAVLTISDDDSRPSVFANSLTVFEPPPVGTGFASLTVRLSNPSVQTVTVNYATSNGTATAGSDYAATSGTLTFNPLETTKTLLIPLLGDQLSEADENFFVNFSGGTNLSYSGGQVMVTIRNYNPLLARRAPFDFDGDNKSDVTVFRPSNGVWYALQSMSGFFGTQFGQQGDISVPADYDGDGRTDIAVFRAGAWYRLNSTTGQFVAVQFGQAGDVPVPGDFDGDGRADIAVWRPSNGTWYRVNSGNGQYVATQFGVAEDKPMIGDFDGDGRSDIAVWRPSNGVWYIIRSQNNTFYGIELGANGDLPVAGDFDGDGQTDWSVFRPSNGTWHRKFSGNGFTAPVMHFGMVGDRPAVADYDGDNRSDIAVFRPSNGTWYILRSSLGFTGVQFGANGDAPAPASFVP